MVITNERIELLANTLMKDADFANELFEMTAADAAAALKAKGFDFSAEELSAFAEDLKAFVEENAELDMESLDDVNGGCFPVHHHHHHYHRPYGYGHYHYGPFCVTVRYRSCRW